MSSSEYPEEKVKVFGEQLASLVYWVIFQT